MRRGILADWPVRDLVAGVSVGLVEDKLLLDLEYAEDSRAAVDAAFVATGRGELVEVQAFGEGRAFPAALFTEMLDLAAPGLRELTCLQEEVLKPWLTSPW
jgi:ribonuclease PH